MFRCNYLTNKKFFCISFFHFLNLYSILNIFKNKWPWWLMYFWTYGLRKTWLEKCLKSPVSDDPSISNILNGQKHKRNLNNSMFTIFIDPCEDDSGWKRLSEWYAKSYDCLLTQWLPITSILLLIDTIYRNIFRCIYLRKEKYFLIFFCIF